MQAFVNKYFFLLFIVITFSSCIGSEELKIEKKLWENGGEWDVFSWKSSNDGVITELMGADISSSYFIFKKEKEAIFIINGDSGDTYTYTMNYEYADGRLILMDVIDVVSGNIEYMSMIYYLTSEKDYLDIRTVNGFAGGVTETMILKK